MSAFITGWALETDYPAGSNPWNGQPCKVAPVGDIFLPDTPLPAEYLNYLFNNVVGAIQQLQQTSPLYIAQNWGVEQNLSAINFTTANPVVGETWSYASWDPPTNRWLAIMMFHETSTSVRQSAVLATQGFDPLTNDPLSVLGGGYWGCVSQTNPVFGVGHTTAAVCGDPVTAGNVHVIVNIYGTAGSYQIYTYSLSGDTWTAGATFAITGGTAALSPELIPFGFHAYGFLPSSTAGNWAIVKMDSIPSFVLTGTASGLTVTSAAMATNQYQPGDSAGDVGPNNLMLLVPRLLGNAAYWTTPDGTTWTQRAFSGFTSGDTFFGVAWAQDASGPCWVLGVNRSGTGKAVFYRSADGISWTISGSFTGTGSGLAACGNILVATLPDNANASSNQNYSPNGGLTWFRSQVIQSQNQATSSPEWITPRVFSSQNQFFSLTSTVARLSAIGGLPMTALT